MLRSESIISMFSVSISQLKELPLTKDLLWVKYSERCFTCRTINCYPPCKGKETREKANLTSGQNKTKTKEENWWNSDFLIRSIGLLLLSSASTHLSSWPSSAGSALSSSKTHLVLRQKGFKPPPLEGLGVSHLHTGSLRLWEWPLVSHQLAPSH